MGTNFYRQRKKDSFNKELAEHYINVGCILGDEGSLEALVKAYKDGQMVHICKRSYGWKMCFDHNWGGYYQPTRESLTKFLVEDGYEIVDEYGNVYSIDEFWNEVNRHNSYSANIYDSKRYWEENQETCRGDEEEDRRMVEDKFGIKTEYDDFYSDDGLRWAVFTDFS